MDLSGGVAVLACAVGSTTGASLAPADFVLSGGTSRLTVRLRWLQP